MTRTPRRRGRRALAALAAVALLVIPGCVESEPGPTSSPDIVVPTPPPPLLEPGPSPSAAQPPSAPSGGNGGGGGALTTTEMSIDPSKGQQTMSGLGVNANVHSWKNGQLKPAIARYAALGPVTWRVIIEKADWEPSQVGNPDVIDPAYYHGIFEAPKMQDLWNTVAYIESFPNQTVSLSVMGGVAPWMGGTTVLPDKEDYWVRMIAALLDYGRRTKGLQLDLISPLNEPDWNGIEGPKVDAGQMTDLLDKLSKRLDGLGMGDVRFVVPDTASAEVASSTYLPVLLKNPVVAAKIAHVGIHSYDGKAGSVPELVSGSSVAAAGTWATEFNSQCDGCDTGTEQADTWDHALEMASDLLSLIDQGASGGQLYDAWDGYYEHHQSVGYWGALKYDPSTGIYSPRSSFTILALFLEGIPAGAVHVASQGANALTSEAFSAGPTGQISVVGANPTASAQRFRVSIKGQPASRAKVITAGPSTGGAVTTDAAVEDGAVLVSVPADSVFVVRDIR
ncbi:MAG TPA: hypothetical protein VJQ61_12875 [Sinomonas sp.]|nr:hypothetical protein [Sinomonas sp.]